MAPILPSRAKFKRKIHHLVNSQYPSKHHFSSLRSYHAVFPDLWIHPYDDGPWFWDPNPQKREHWLLPSSSFWGVDRRLCEWYLFEETFPKKYPLGDGTVYMDFWLLGLVGSVVGKLHGMPAVSGGATVAYPVSYTWE